MDWTWKADAASNPRLRLRYEPGSWGDVLKGVWAGAAAASLARSRGPGPALLDPFAGAPSYPRVAAVAARLDALRALADPLVRAFLDHADAGGRAALPSTAIISLSAAGPSATLEAFDLDAPRRAAWVAAGVSALDVASGEEALLRPADLVLVDPYDLARDWPALRPRLAARRDDALLLLYLFNRAPRAAAALREYRALRADLDVALGGRALLVGRAPSDATLPRAWHEVLLSGPAAALAPLRAPLEAATLALSRHITDRGAFEARGV